MTIIDEFKQKISRGQIIFRGQAVRDFVDYAAGMEADLKEARSELEKLRGELAIERTKNVALRQSVADLTERNCDDYAELKEQLASETRWAKEYHDQLQAAREDADRLAKELADCARFIEITGIGIIPPEIHAALAAHEALKGQP